MAAFSGDIHHKSRVYKYDYEGETFLETILCGEVIETYISIIRTAFALEYSNKTKHLW